MRYTARTYPFLGCSVVVLTLCTPQALTLPLYLEVHVGDLLEANSVPLKEWLILTAPLWKNTENRHHQSGPCGKWKVRHQLEPRLGRRSVGDITAWVISNSETLTLFSPPCPPRSATALTTPNASPFKHPSPLRRVMSALFSPLPKSSLAALVAQRARCSGNGSSLLQCRCPGRQTFQFPYFLHQSGLIMLPLVIPNYQPGTTSPMHPHSRAANQAGRPKHVLQRQPPTPSAESLHVLHLPIPRKLCPLHGKQLLLPRIMT